MTNTPPRSIRIDDKLWKMVKAKAKKEHTTATAVIVRLLVDWLKT